MMLFGPTEERIAMAHLAGHVIVQCECSIGAPYAPGRAIRYHEPEDIDKEHLYYMTCPRCNGAGWYEQPNNGYVPSHRLITGVGDHNGQLAHLLTKSYITNSNHPLSGLSPIFWEKGEDDEETIDEGG